MKKLIFLVGVFATMAMGAFAQTVPSHAKYIDYAADTEWSTAYNALSESEIGTKALYEDLDSEAAENEQFFISRVKPRKRFIFTDTQVKTSLNPNRKLLWWCPIGCDGWNALPTYFYGSEVYSMWSYTDIYGNWTAPMVRMPAAMLDICHKNGVVTSTLASVPWAAYISPDQVPHGANFKALIDGGSSKFLKYLRYYGIDGIGFNSEFSFSGTVSGVNFETAMKNFLSSCFRDKDQYNMGTFHNCWYSLMTNEGSCGGSLALNAGNKDWFHYNGNPTSNAYFMNYGFNSTYLATSESTANSFSGRSSFDVYAGMDFQGSSSARWPDLVNYNISVGLWGAHNMNMMYEFRGENGSSPQKVQQTYQLISENVFTGSSYNPVNTPEIGTRLCHTSKATDFHGFSSFITARSSLTPQDGGDLSTDPFVTYFNLGNGTFFNYEGITTFNNEWYNIGMQDHLPTWRWWWTKNFMGKNASDASTDLTAEFTWNDAWFGGSCLQISGATDKAYLQLFKTKYPLVSGDKVVVRYKVISGTGSIYLTGSTENAPTTEVSATINSSASFSSDWQTKTITINNRGFKVYGQTLALLGLKFQNTSSDFKVLIGEISITRGTANTPGTPTVSLSKAMARTYKGIDMKIIFDMSHNFTGTRQTYDPIYNSDVDTWYYKIYTQQEGCDPVLCTTTTSWAAYVVGAPYDLDKGGKIRIGVAAVSLDGKNESATAWGTFISAPQNKTVEGFSIDKPIIKANEEFTVAFDDPTHAAATWVIKASENDAVKGTFNATSFTTSLSEEGIYDLYLTQDGITEIYRGKIQISPAAVGAMPLIESFTLNGDEVNAFAMPETSSNFAYVGREDADGTVSRGLALQEKAFGISADNLAFTSNTPFSLTFWIYINNLNHEQDGTQFLNVRSDGDVWPSSDWGYIWSMIDPENKFEFQYRSGSMNAGISVPISDEFEFKTDTWYHIAMVMGYTSNRTLALYVNGKLVGSGKVADGDYIFSWRTTNKIMIGGKAANRAALDATIDEVRLYKKELTAAEVKTSMSHLTGSAPTELIGYWDFENDANSDYSMPSSVPDNTLDGRYQTAGVWEKNEAGKFALLDPAFAPGAPFIAGDKYKITTLPTWKIPGTVLLSSEGDGKAGSASVVYSDEGDYVAELILENGWGKASKSIYVHVTEMGIEDSQSNEAKVYPNPFEEELYVTFETSGIYIAEIYDNAGRLMNSITFNASVGEIYQVPVDGESGIYLVKLKDTNSGVAKTLKLIKK
ncbi:MAG: T9SS type A sorting domain-containing protein [Bacteroidales bacterium]|nr:T9SS type A sorting domain-containing protein [Bacteroidales bacterium]